MLTFLELLAQKNRINPFEPWIMFVSTYRVDHMIGNAVLCWLWVSWLTEGIFLGSNERYIPKLQNDTNLALVPWVTLVLGEIQVSKKTLNSPLVIFYENWHDVKILIGRYQLFLAQNIPLGLKFFVIFCFYENLFGNLRNFILNKVENLLYAKNGLM